MLDPAPTERRSARVISLIVGIFVALLATGVYWYATGMQRGPLSAPMAYEGDPLQYGYIIQSFSQSGGLSSIDNAGAPFGTQNVDFPNGDLSNMAIAATLFSGGYGLGFNLYLLLSVALTALAGFGIARHCGLARGPALLVALAFALLPFHFQRISHLFYTNYTTAAVALWLSLRLASPLFDRSRATRDRWLGVGAVALACIWCGTTGVYYAFFSCIVLAIAAVVQSARAASVRPAIRAVAILTGISICVAIQLIPTRTHNQTDGKNPSVGQRSMVESEVYGLKLAQLLLPVHGHRIGLLATLRERYDAQALNINENSTATLGTLGSAGFMMSLLILFVPRVRRRFPHAQQLCAVLVVSLFIYATVGGLGSLFALGVSPQIRALNRISPFIGLFSLIVAAGTLQLLWQHLRSRHPMLARNAGLILAGFAVLVILDQVSPGFRNTREQRAAVAAKYESDRAFAQGLASRLPAGSRVMQLPYSPYPESPDLLGSYAQFRNNLHAPSLHWSHGAMRGRPEGNWLAAVNELPAESFVDVLQAVGFSALVIDNRVSSQKMLDIEKRFSERTRAVGLTAPDSSQKALLSATPWRATARAFTQENGWHATEAEGQRHWSWSLDRPTFALSPAEPGAGECDVQLSLASIRQMKVKVVDSQGQVLAESEVKPEAVSVINLRIPAGTRRIVLENDVPAAPAGNGDPRPLALRWERTADALPLCTYAKIAQQ
ncbi:hypothetical protein [Stenotrophomonas rhizophila]|jgi:phosphoglycerol transferase|uniref:hypothetical protein n=1 Tax=Stenotrophomonas rhizophila TaxID=216778 RepID=UPI001AEBB5C8|nr:hypothetical protein [Stenotrophomonas rhizophila]